MNPTLLRLVASAAGSTLSSMKKGNDKREREIYQALLQAVEDDNLDHVTKEADIDGLEDIFDTARAEAGDVTRDIHARLDRRRAAFAAAAPDRKVRRAALEHDAKWRKKNAKKKKASNAGKILGGVLGVAAVGAAAWAAWEYWLSDKLQDKSGTNKTTKTTTYRKATPRTETDSRGRSTLVYSTRTENAAANMTNTATTMNTSTVHNELRPDADMRGAGPLGEAPAERDEDLLASIDEQLTSLDTLEDEQREVTEPRHGDEGLGKHELRPDRENRES